jgi:hypothetical protein
MHSGMRGGPHVGALRRRSFTEYGELLQAESTSVFRKAICCLASNRSKGDFVSVRCNCGLSVPDRPDDKTHTLADLRRFPLGTVLYFYGKSHTLVSSPVLRNWSFKRAELNC